jgi:hypothetical protein
MLELTYRELLDLQLACAMVIEGKLLPGDNFIENLKLLQIKIQKAKNNLQSN